MKYLSRVLMVILLSYVGVEGSSGGDRDDENQETMLVLVQNPIMAKLNPIVKEIQDLGYNRRVGIRNQEGQLRYLIEGSEAEPKVRSIRDKIRALTTEEINTPIPIGMPGFSYSLLEMAITQSVPEVVPDILNKRADVQSGYPLHYAAAKLNKKAVRLIIAKRADVNKVYLEKTPLDEAIAAKASLSLEGYGPGERSNGHTFEKDTYAADRIIKRLRDAGGRTKAELDAASRR